MIVLNSVLRATPVGSAAFMYTGDGKIAELADDLKQEEVEENFGNIAKTDLIGLMNKLIRSVNFE